VEVNSTGGQGSRRAVAPSGGGGGDDDGIRMNKACRWYSTEDKLYIASFTYSYDSEINILHLRYTPVSVRTFVFSTLFVPCVSILTHQNSQYTGLSLESPLSRQR
jgi:hypothetical protein